MSEFRLQKWYVDIADDAGRVYIGYWGKLDWGALHTTFFQHLHTEPGQPPRSRAGLGRKPPPIRQADGAVSWDTGEAIAQWKPESAHAYDEVLVRQGKGEIRWQCILPRARASLQFGSRSLEGWGYVECIEMTIPPTDLPFDTLYWGRSHSEHHDLVWIKWEGATAQDLAWHDGVREQHLTIADTGISTRSLAFRISEPYTIRHETLGTTVARSLGTLVKQLPRMLLNLDEHKCYSRGELVGGDFAEPATAIFEKVRW